MNLWHTKEEEPERMLSLNQAVQMLAKPKPNKLLQETVQVLKEDLREVVAERDALRQKALSHDKLVAQLTRERQAAYANNDALIEAVFLLAECVTNDNYEGRTCRERVRKLLEAQGIPPPSTLGSSRNRPKRGKRLPPTPEST
jgi:hypothetical protein